MAAGWLIRASGLVQGVGFRPTVWQVVQAMGLKGSVRNTAAGVTIELCCDAARREAFVQALKAALPKLARIDALEVSELSFEAEPEGFTITDSEEGTVSASIVADAMLCEACASDIRDPANRRFRYAFTNCTHCGPRLSIIRRIPYDRANTAMAAFPMCEDCRAEYENPADRRYHAEPIACPRCGPKLWLETAADVGTPDLPADPLEGAAALLAQGLTVAIKGLGGFHLACLASDESAVDRLRARKRRPSKPLAVMVGNRDWLLRIAFAGAEELELIAGQRGPILLLRPKPDAPLANSIAPGQSRIGVMLPTTPLHALLMDRLGQPLVMTSANESGYPQCISNEEARGLLGAIADAVLLHDRDIEARVDDSVLRLDGHGPTMIRRARGYAPEPFRHVELADAPSVFAAGGDIKSAFAFAGRGEVTLSQYLGDLDNWETRQAWLKAARLYATLFERRPDIVAVDSHPGYHSSALGRELAQEWEASVVEVQHHHAHLAACLAEHRWQGGPVLGIILDGTGFGPDGTIWGGEFLGGDARFFRRLAHLPAVPLPGGDSAAMEPWRNAYAQLMTCFGPDVLEGRWRGLEPIERLRRRHTPAMAALLNSRRLSPITSSAGRLFDAAAFMIGIAPERQDYEGQAGMELEALAEPYMTEAFAYAYPSGTEGVEVDWKGLWTGLMTDCASGGSKGWMAARFHRTLIDSVAAIAARLAGDHGFTHVALSGGVFQNAILLHGVKLSLEARGLEVLAHSAFPANDGGLALGQAAIAMRRKV